MPPEIALWISPQRQTGDPVAGSPAEMNRLDELSDAERQRLEREAHRAGPHFPRWSRLERFQFVRLKQSLDQKRPLFDLTQMILTAALVIGLATFVSKSAPEGGWGFLQMVSVWIFAALLIINLIEPVIRLIELWSTQFYIENLLEVPAKGQRSFSPIFFFVAVIVLVGLGSLAYSVGQEAANRTAPAAQAPSK